VIGLIFWTNINLWSKKMSLKFQWVGVLLGMVGSVATANESRQWTGSGDHYVVNAKYVTADDKRVVLEDETGELVILQTAQLSATDQEYVAAKRTLKRLGDPEVALVAAKVPAAETNSVAPAPQNYPATWRLQGGGEINGVLVGFARQEFNVRRERGELYVDAYELGQLPAAYDMVLPTVVGTIDKTPLKDVDDMEIHLAKLGGGPFKYIVDGIQINLQGGGSITIPLEILEPNYAALVRPGFDRWLASRAEDVSAEDRYATESRERLMLDSYAQLQPGTAIRQRQFRQLELGYFNVATGITSVWEVTLIPNTAYGYPFSVVVNARDSLQAQQLALQNYPGWQIGPTRKLSGL